MVFLGCPATQFDKRVSQSDSPQEQRLDETETGEGTTVTLIDAKQSPGQVNANPDEVAEWLGLAPDASGLVAWDVFDAVLTPGQYYPAGCPGVTNPLLKRSRVGYYCRMERGFAASVWYAITECSTGARRRNITPTLHAPTQTAGDNGHGTRNFWILLTTSLVC
jgi:hypothetical protein